MSMCLKTGAYFLVRPHNFHLVGDIHVIEATATAILRVNPESMSYTPERAITHVVELDGKEWDRASDLGVIVVPMLNLKLVSEAF